MKKFILSLFLLISFTFSFAQKSNVSKAEDKALKENPDFAGAREAIKLALQDSTTKNEANTWYVAGLIGYTQNDVLYQKQAMGLPINDSVKGQAILESYPYFLEAYKLDQLPDVKGQVKPKFAKKIKGKLKEYYTVQQNLFAYGAFLYDNKKDYEGAIKAWNVYLEIPTLPMMNNEIKLDSNYYMIKYFSALASIKAEKHANAIALLEDLKDDNYETIRVYKLLNQEYLTSKDTANSVKILKEGSSKFSSEPWFLQNLINYFIFSGKKSEALVYLNSAIEQDPTMAELYFVKGDLEVSLDKFVEARVSFNKAIELNPTMADAYAGMGRSYYNEAVRIIEKADKIKDIKLSQIESKKSESVFKESIPFFKKAAEVNPKEIEYKQTLKNLYYKLRMDADYDAIKKEIDAMK